MINKPPTGKAKYIARDATSGTLTITMQKRKKQVETHYEVTKIETDTRVADPAFELVKEDGEVYHVAMDEYGYTCSCPHYVFRGHQSQVPCKHCLAMAAVGLIPKPVFYPGQHEANSPSGDP